VSEQEPHRPRLERCRAAAAPPSRDRADERERRAAALAAYQGARGELGAVLEAERTITETELGLIQALAERAKAWANLNFLYLHEAVR
jgi:outer membrane protein TolC